MRFIMNGREYCLSQSVVRARLSDQTPEEIRQYWVEVDGVRWPVKQALRLATGSSEFQSQTARHHLSNLGFVVGGEAKHRATAAAGPPRGGSVDPEALPVIESIDARVSFSWRRAGAVTLDASGVPRFPEVPRSPGLYRFDFGVGADGKRGLYIGESEDLRKRAGNYRNAKKDGGRNRTSRRIHREVVAHLLSGGDIDFAIATEVHIEGDTTADLRRKSARRLAENAAVLKAQLGSRVRVLNIDTDLTDEDE